MIGSERIFRRLQIVYCGLVLAFLLAPVLIVIPMAFSSTRYLTFPPPGFSLQYFDEVFFGEISREGGKASKDWLGALKNTILIGTTTSVIATVLGTSTAIGLVRSRFPGKALLMAFVISPMIVPLIITAVGMFFLYVQLNLIGSFAGMVIAHSVLAAPFVVIVVSATLYGVDPNLERAAMGLGASPARAFMTVTVPIISPGVITGALFAFITSFDEVVVALFLSGASYRTLPVRMFEGLRFEIDPAISAVGTLVIVVASLVLGTSIFLQRHAERMRVSHH
jgi:putative spermidine/putrescine transport system permease protein